MENYCCQVFIFAYFLFRATSIHRVNNFDTLSVKTAFVELEKFNVKAIFATALTTSLIRVARVGLEE